MTWSVKFLGFPSGLYVPFGLCFFLIICLQTDSAVEISSFPSLIRYPVTLIQDVSWKGLGLSSGSPWKPDMPAVFSLPPNPAAQRLLLAHRGLLTIQVHLSTHRAEPSHPSGQGCLVHSFCQSRASLTIAAVFSPGLDGVWINLNKHKQSSWLVGWEAWAGGTGPHCIICGYLWL